MNALTVSALRLLRDAAMTVGWITAAVMTTELFI